MNCHWLAGALPSPVAWQGFVSRPSPRSDGSCLGLSCPAVLTEEISHQARSRTADTRDRPPRAALIGVRAYRRVISIRIVFRRDRRFVDLFATQRLARPLTARGRW